MTNIPFYVQDTSSCHVRRSSSYIMVINKKIFSVQQRPLLHDSIIVYGKYV